MSNMDNPQRTAEAVLKKDRRRIRLLAGLTIALWLVAALLIPSVYLPLGGMVKQYAKILAAHNPGMSDRIFDRKEADLQPIAPEKVPMTLARIQHDQWLLSELVMHQWIVGAIILGLALMAGILAAGSTVALALTIRRVTLRQVSEQLAQISEQLRLLKT